MEYFAVFGGQEEHYRASNPSFRGSSLRAQSLPNMKKENNHHKGKIKNMHKVSTHNQVKNKESLPREREMRDL